MSSKSYSQLATLAGIFGLTSKAAKSEFLKPRETASPEEPPTRPRDPLAQLFKSNCAHSVRVNSGKKLW